MPYKGKYRTKARSIYYRKKKEYNRYVKNYQKAKKILAKKGLEPYGESMYKFDEYFSYKESEINDTGKENVQRRMIQKQMYQYSYNQSVLLKRNLDENIVKLENELKNKKLNKKEISEINRQLDVLRKNKKMSLTEIRTGTNFDLEFLSDVNENLKKEHPNWSGTDRKNYIRKEWFGYAA